MSDYWKKKMDELNRETKKPSASPSYWDMKLAQLEEEKKQHKKIVSELSKKKDDDIAPVKKDEDEGLDFFQKSSLFDDGYDFGDVTKTILGTVGDAGLNVVKGAASLGEGLVDVAGYGVAGLADFSGADEYADDLRKRLSANYVDKLMKPAEEKLDKYSVLGRTSDNIMQGVGQVGTILLTGGLAAGAGVSATAATTGVMGLSGMGSGMGEAYQNNATDLQALKHGFNTGAADAISELIFGGLGKGINALGFSRGLSSADDMLARVVGSKFKNQAAKNIVEFGIKSGAEGLEEVISGVAQAISKHNTYMSDTDLVDILKDENLLEQFVVGAFTSGLAQGSGLHIANKTGTDFITGLNQDEQAVVKREIESRIAEQEKDGKKLTAKEKAAIEEQVERDFERGYISTDLIDEVVGGDVYTEYKKSIEREDALFKEFEELGNTQNATLAQQYRYGELRDRVQSIKDNDIRSRRKEALDKHIAERVNGTRLAESYNERARRGQAFESDVTQYDEKYKATYQRAIDSGVLNNTNRSHELVDTVARISADKGIVFDFTNTSKMREMGMVEEGVVKNGFITKDGITINVDSAKAWQSIAGHEVTHALEQSEHYAELQEAVFEYAKTKGEYDSRLDAITKLYAKYDPDADPTKELTADLVGDYIFTDENFVNNLAVDNRNLFQKIWDEVKYLWKTVTAGSKEARELEKVKRAFEKAYKESGKAQVEGTKHSLSDSEGSILTDEQSEYFKDSKAVDENGNLLVLCHGGSGRTVYNGRGEGTWSQGIYLTDSKEVADAFATHRYDKKGKTQFLYANAKNPLVLDAEGRGYTDIPVPEDAPEWLRDFAWYDGTTDMDNLPVEAFKHGYDSVIVRNVREGVGGEPMTEVVVKDSNQVKEVFNEKPTSDADIRYSLSDSDGKQLTKAQQEYFKDSKMRDKNGNLKVMYHGTADGGFHTFNNRYSDDGASFFFVDNNAVARTYSGTSETYSAQAFRTAEDFNNFFKEIRANEYSVVEADGEFQLLEDGDVIATSDTADGIYEEFRDWTGKGYGNVNYKVYLNLVNPFIFDAKGAEWNGLPNIKGDDTKYEYIKVLSDNDDNTVTIEYALTGDPAPVTKDVVLFADFDDGLSEQLANLEFGEVIRDVPANPNTTRDYAEYARKNGYDGVIFENINDNGGYGYAGTATVAIAFDSNQIKSVANTSPTADKDIRYSLSVDSKGRELPPAVKKRFANSKVVDEDGDLKAVYHGTYAGEFTIFDKSKGSVEGDFGSGFYFTDNEDDVETNYEGGGHDYENKVARRAEQIEQEEDIDYDEAKERAREELFKGGHKFEVYLNIENPAIVGKTILLDGESVREQYDEDDFDDYDEYIEEVEQAVYEEIENIVWEVEKNVDVYSTDGLFDVLFEAYSYGGVDIETLKENVAQLYLEDGEGNFVGNEVVRQVIESLGYDGIIDPTVSSKFKNMGMEADTTHYIVFKPNQIKAVTNQTPTDNPDIHLSMSADGEHRPTGSWYTPAYETALEIAPTQEDVAPVVKTTDETKTPVSQTNATPVEELFPDDMAPISEGYDADRMNSLFYEEAPPEMDAPYFEDYYEGKPAEVKDPFEDRDFYEIGKQRSVKAYQYENPEVKPFFTEMAKVMLQDIRDGIKGEKWYNSQVGYEYGNEAAWGGTKRQIASDIAELLDYGYTRDQLNEGLRKIIEDDGKENNAVSKRIEFVLNDRLLYGWTDMWGQPMPANPDYIKLMEEKEITEYSKEAFAALDDRYAPPVVEDIAPVQQKVEPVAPQRTITKEGGQMALPLYPDPNNVSPAMGEVQTDGDIAPVFDTESGQQALMPEEEKPAKIRRKELHANIISRFKDAFHIRGFELDDVLKNAKDLSTFATVDNIPQRVMEKALGYKEGGILADLTVNKVAQNETAGIKWLNSFTDRKTGVLAKISKQYDIKPGSKESAAAQMYAEGFYVTDNGDIVEYGDRELAKDFPDFLKQAQIKGLARDPRIRKIYDDTLAAINESRVRNAYPEIPRLDNYFLHFRAMNDTFSKLGLPFNPNDIRAKDLPTDLNGVTADLKPGQPFFASAMHRKGKRTSFDLLGGLEQYLNAAKNQIYHIDDIQNLRALRNYIADTYGQANGLEGLDELTEEEQQQRIEDVFNSHLSTFAKHLNEEANILAGKTALIDRGLEGVIGRRGMTFLTELNKQVGSNMVGYNVSSSLTNFVSLAQGIAKSNKAAFVKGLAQFAANKVNSIRGTSDGFAEESPVMIRRKGAERFHRTMWQKLSDPGYLMMQAVDSVSTELIARAKFNELTAKGMDAQQAHIETDKWVSRLMGDRSLGQMPQLFNSKTLGIVTKFQLEVRNQLDSQFYDTYQDAKLSAEQIENKLTRNAVTAAKVTSTLLQLSVAQHLFGQAFESVAGYNPAFDIIDTIMKTFGWDDDEDDEDTVLDNIEEGFLALLEDLPYTSTFTGGRIPMASALPIGQLIKGKDQYGNDKSRWETLSEAAPYYFLPGGYSQIKKTVGGLGMFDEEHPVTGSYTDSGNLRFPVEDNLANRAQAAVFGQWASGNAREYFDNERTALKEKQVQEFSDSGMTIQEYWAYRDGLKGKDTLGEKVAYINSLDLPIATKNLLVNNISDRKEAIDLSDYGEYDDWGEFEYAHKYPDKYEFFKDNNISVEQYQNFDDDTKDAWNWAYQNPEKLTVSRAVTSDVVQYRQFANELNDLKADKDSEGKSISGSRKEKVVDYVNSLDIDYGARLILFKSEYKADDTYNADIVEYLNSRNDISFEEEVTILRELGFTVDANGNVYWD